MELSGKIALLTGATSGIGRATAVLFARHGARLALAGRNPEALQAVAQETNQLGAEAITLPMDVIDPEQCHRAVADTVARYGGLEVLINAAGIIASGSLASTTLAAWQQMMSVNLTAIFTLMQAALPHLEKSRGNIVNVSSVTGLRAFPNVLAYCVSKAGVDQLTRCAALELAAAGVRVNAVNPGVVVSNLHRRSGMSEDKYAAFLEHSTTTHPMGRVGAPPEVAEAILFLASGRAGWITGVTLSIDGGRQLTCAR